MSDYKYCFWFLFGRVFFCWLVVWYKNVMCVSLDLGIKTKLYGNSIILLYSFFFFGICNSKTKTKILQYIGCLFGLSVYIHFCYKKKKNWKDFLFICLVVFFKLHFVFFVFVNLFESSSQVNKGKTKWTQKSHCKLYLFRIEL